MRFEHSALREGDRMVEAADRAFFAGADPRELMRTLRSLAST
jgi:hypothetical protein